MNKSTGISKTGREKITKALRDLSEQSIFWDSTPAELFHGDRVFHGRVAFTDQAVALVASSNVAVCLKDLLLKRFVPLDKEQKRALFSNNGPVATFRAMIRMAHAMGLVGRLANADLHLIREVRNAFAHTGRHIDFSHEAIANACDLLSVPRYGIDIAGNVLPAAAFGPKDKFTETCKWIGMNIAFVADRKDLTASDELLYPRSPDVLAQAARVIKGRL